MIEPLMDQTIGGGAVLAFGLPGGQEWLILLVLGLLIFGRRLPEVGRSLGRGIVEFKKGIKGIEDDIEESSSTPASLPSNAPPPSLAAPAAGQPTAAQPSAPASVSQSSVGAEGANPYAPKEAPAKDE